MSVFEDILNKFRKKREKNFGMRRDKNVNHYSVMDDIEIRDIDDAILIRELLNYLKYEKGFHPHQISAKNIRSMADKIRYKAAIKIAQKGLFIEY